MILACTITASSVAICGQVGWVGLDPHVTRSLVTQLSTLLPAAAILGSVYLLVCDTICRNAFSVELPIGILTSLIGIPFSSSFSNREQVAHGAHGYKILIPPQISQAPLRISGLTTGYERPDIVKDISFDLEPAVLCASLAKTDAERQHYEGNFALYPHVTAASRSERQITHIK